MVDDGAFDATLFHACPTFYAALLVDNVLFLAFASDAIPGAFLDANAASYTLICDFIY